MVLRWYKFQLFIRTPRVGARGLIGILLITHKSTSVTIKKWLLISLTLVISIIIKSIPRSKIDLFLCLATTIDDNNRINNSFNECAWEYRHELISVFWYIWEAKIWTKFHDKIFNSVKNTNRKNYFKRLESFLIHFFLFSAVSDNLCRQ